MATESLTDNRTVKQKTKDSVFTTLFKDINNVYTLYRELHPEDTSVTVDDIKIETLETVLINEVYNDLGFIVKESLNKSRLTAQHSSRLHLFRHLAPNSLENRQVSCAHLIQSDEKSDCAI